MNKQAGYTLTEIIVSLAITAVIFGVIAGVVLQLSTVSGRGNDELTAVHNLQNANYWFSRDGQSASSASGASSLTLSLPSGQTIVYSLSGQNLQRNDGQTSRIIAGNISNLSFSQNGKLVTMNIVSSISGRANVVEQGIYQIYMRAD
jgi:prepilin-type N-terminal cleavage/methylation domain-containing protein